MTWQPRDLGKQTHTDEPLARRSPREQEREEMLALPTYQEWEDYEADEATSGEQRIPLGMEREMAEQGLWTDRNWSIWRRMMTRNIQSI